MVRFLVGRKKGEGFPGFWAEFAGEEVSSYTETSGEKHIVYPLCRCTAYDREGFPAGHSCLQSPSPPLHQLRSNPESKPRVMWHDNVPGYGGEERLIAVHGQRRFLGELSLLTGQVAFFTAVVREPGEVLVVPVERLRALVTHDTVLGDIVLHAYLLRREMLIGLGAGFQIVGSRYSPDTRRLREFAARNRLSHRWIDLKDDEEAEALLKGLGVAPEETPVVIWRGNQVLRNPSNEELAETIGLRERSVAEDVWDLLVVGTGPAGLAAAVYGASEGLGTVALDAVATGGQAGTSPKIENYLGFPSGISGEELAARAEIQAEKFGARISVPAESTALEERDGCYVVSFEDGSEATARTVLITTGARYRKLDVPGLEDFEGTCVYYAATMMEARVCRGDPVAVVGGGNSAGQATLFLAQHTQKVSLLIRHEDLGRDMSRYLADGIERNPKVEVLRHTEVREPVGDGTLEALIVENNQTDERRRIEARELFVFIGAEPCTRWLADKVALDDRGLVLTGRAARSAGIGKGQDGGHEPYLLETSLPGVFAAGDVRSGSIKRVASAVGEGRWPSASCTLGSRIVGIPDMPRMVDRCRERARATCHAGHRPNERGGLISNAKY